MANNTNNVKGNNNQEFGKTLNVVKVAGVVKDAKLFFYDPKEGNVERGRLVMGTLTVKTGKTNETRVSVRANEFNKPNQDGEISTNKTFELLENIYNKEEGFEMLSAGVSEEEAIKVSIYSNNNDFAPRLSEDFNTKDPENIKTSVKVDMGFGYISVKENLTPEEYKAEFVVKMFASEICEEEKDNKATGRCIVKGYVPCYGGRVFPFQVVAGILPATEEEEEYDFGYDLLGYLQPNMTLTVCGDIINSVEIIKEKIGGAKRSDGRLSMGRARVEERKVYTNEFLIVSCDEVPINEDFDFDAIQKGIVERDTYIDELKEKAIKKQENTESTTAQRSRGINRRETNETRRRDERTLSAPRNKVTEDKVEDECPFEEDEKQETPKETSRRSRRMADF